MEHIDASLTPTDETEKTGKAGYIELTEAEADRQFQNLQQFLSVLFPEDLTTDDLVFRFIKIPENSQKRKKRIEDIIDNGTDRTSRWHLNNFSLLSLIGREYKDEAQQAGVRPQDMIFGVSGDYFQQLIQRVGFIAACKVYHYYIGGSEQPNAILVYDAKTMNGLRLVEKTVYTFNNPSQKQKALLGVIAIKK